MTKQVGFTLIELMVVVAIVGVLSAIAFPQFKSYSEKVGRTDDCKAPLLEIAVELEEYHAVNQTYPAAGDLSTTTIPYDGTRGNYTYNLDPSTATTYTLRCVPIDTNVDTDCGMLTYDNFGRKGAPNATNGRTAEICWR